jgi:hypothetical protein
MIKKRLAEIGLATAGWYQSTVYQLELDLWEPKDLITITDRLARIRDVRLAGLLIALRSLVIDRWVGDVIEKM